ncbi:type VI lipase adapter Tla3 domain-containing protein [Pseudomonas aeruginosa]|uniref:type VI lipase adapter Tla3 domain-containing protein n=1 Tax=Pseudomonas aeruginosa TaxID=287 RepID=UPI003204D03E
MFAAGVAASALASQANGTDLSAMRCFASPATSVTAYAPAKEAAMSADAYHVPKTSPRLETLDVLSIGMSLDVFRQGQVWKAMQEQNAAQAEVLHIGSILPMDPNKYPITADDKNLAYEKRQADALELGLKSFLEKWPIPTITVVRGWNPETQNLRFSPERTKESLSAKVNDLRIPAGLHWHRIVNLQDGIICNDTPEGVLEALFQLFERHADLPAVLVYANEGISMTYALSSRDVSRKSLGAVAGPRQSDKLTDTMVALIVGRPERVDWLRQYAPYTKVNENRIDPEFRGWGWRKPPVEFRPTRFIPQPWTARALEQWDALPVLARLHRPVSVPLTRPDTGERLKREALTAQLAAGWKTACATLTPAPARLFYDGGLNATPLAELTPALGAAQSSLDLLDSRESYDLTQRLGDTGAASPFVGIALATMASYLNGDSSMVMPLRRKDQATLIGISSPTPGKKPAHDPFGVDLLPQTASGDGPPPSADPTAPASRLATRLPPGEDYALEKFLSGLKPRSDWLDD